MHEKRFTILKVTVLLCFLLLAARILYFQGFDSENLTKAASSQRIASSGIEKPRGAILDRNGISFTGKEKKYTAVLQPLYLRGNKDDISRICETLGINETKTLGEINTKSQPILLEVDEARKDQLLSMNIRGVSVVYSFKRYSTGSLAKHINGYLNRSDQVGQAGLEKFYEEQLGEDEKYTIGVVTDARKNLVEGLGYRIKKSDGSNALNVQLTLDYHIQKIVEDVMGRMGITGAVVVEEVNTGDIVAMASKPDYDQNSVENYLNSSGNELFNRATAGYNLGSVFKIIDAAAYLESETPIDMPEYYTCIGSVTVGKNEFKCSSYSTGGHGDVNFEQAFAESCNPYFIELGLKLGYKKLIETAAQFGLGEYTGVKDQGISEYKGNLPDPTRNHSQGDIANLSIGQGEVMATPLQAADIVATIANGGIKNKINIVKGIVDQDGNPVQDLRVKSGKRVVSKTTADSIQRLLEAAVDYGTGQAAALAEYGGAAGKTGSAETGKTEIVHAWFAGYFPRSQPKYSIAVFVENGQYGGKAAAPVFAEIAAEIAKKGL